MTPDLKQLKEILLLSIGTLIVASSITVSFLSLGNMCSRLINQPIFYPSSWR